MLVSESLHCSEGDMELLRSLHTHVLHAWVFKEAKWSGLCWIFKNFSKALKCHVAWNFDILNDTLALVCGESSCVLLNFEAEWFAVSNLNGAKSVEFGHSFNFPKDDVVSILERVSLVFMDCDITQFVLLNT